jgi:hypothetical protein
MQAGRNGREVDQQIDGSPLKDRVATFIYFKKSARDVVKGESGCPGGRERNGELFHIREGFVGLDKRVEVE